MTSRFHAILFALPASAWLVSFLASGNSLFLKPLLSAEQENLITAFVDQMDVGVTLSGSILVLSFLSLGVLAIWLLIAVSRFLYAALRGSRPPTSLARVFLFFGLMQIMLGAVGAWDTFEITGSFPMYSIGTLEVSLALLIPFLGVVLGICCFSLSTARAHLNNFAIKRAGMTS